MMRRRRRQRDGQTSSDTDPQVSRRDHKAPAAASYPALATAKSQVGRGSSPRVDGSEQGRRSSEAAATPGRAHASAHPHPDLAALARSEEQARVGTSTPPARQVRLSPKGTPGDPGYEVIAPGDEDKEAIDDGAETEGAEEPAEEPETATTVQDEGGDPPRVVVLAEDPDVSVVSEQYLGLESPTVKDTINLSPSLIGQMLPAMPAKQAKMGPVTDAVGQIAGEQAEVGRGSQETTGATVATTTVTAELVTSPAVTLSGARQGIETTPAATSAEDTTTETPAVTRSANLEHLLNLARSWDQGVTDSSQVATTSVPVPSSAVQSITVEMSEFLQWKMDKERREGRQPQLPYPVTRPLTGPFRVTVRSPPGPTRHVTLGSMTNSPRSLDLGMRRLATTRVVSATATGPSLIPVTSEATTRTTEEKQEAPPPPPPPAETKDATPSQPALATANSQVGRDLPPRADGPEREEKASATAKKKSVTWGPAPTVIEPPPQPSHQEQDEVPLLHRGSCARTRTWSRWEKLVPRRHPGHKRVRKRPRSPDHGAQRWCWPHYRLRRVTKRTVWPRWSRSRANYSAPRTLGILERQRIKDVQRKMAPTKPYHGKLCFEPPEPAGQPPQRAPSTEWVEAPERPTGLLDTPRVGYWSERTRQAVLLRQRQEEAERLALEALEEPLSPGRDEVPENQPPGPPPPTQPPEQQATPAEGQRQEEAGQGVPPPVVADQNPALVAEEDLDPNRPERDDGNPHRRPQGDQDEEEAVAGPPDDGQAPDDRDGADQSKGKGSGDGCRQQ